MNEGNLSAFRHLIYNEQDALTAIKNLNSSIFVIRFFMSSGLEAKMSLIH